MKKELTNKQKIIVAIIILILIIIVGIYGFITKNQDDGIELVSMDNSIIEQGLIENVEIENNKNLQDNIEKKIIVHIAGEVNNTGIVTLKEGARIADAIEAAGGATKNADLNEVNLAFVLEDGQKIYIPNKKDKELNNEKVYITSESGNNVIVNNEVKSGGGSKKVNINTALQSDLETLPGIGAAIANRIIEYREQNGKFNKIEDLMNVKGIGDAKFANIKDLITVNKELK